MHKVGHSHCIIDHEVHAIKVGRLSLWIEVADHHIQAHVEALHESVEYRRRDANQYVGEQLPVAGLARSPEQIGEPHGKMDEKRQTSKPPGDQPADLTIRIGQDIRQRILVAEKDD